MKKISIILLLLILMIPSNVLATSGYLRSDSIKTCPNGKTYGQHGNGHWHRAKKEGYRYKAIGSAIKNDPCPPKSDDNDIKTLKVDGNVLDINYNDEASYETYNKKIKIEVKTSDSKAKVKNNYKELKEGNNKITITVTAQNGEKKNYTLNVLLKKMDTSIKEIKIDDKIIEVKETMSYETNNSDIKIEVTPNNHDVKVSNDYKKLVDGENTITIKLTASNGDIGEYKLIVLKNKKDTSIKEIRINRDLIEISDNMSYETCSKTLNIDVTPTNPEAKVTNDYTELIEGNNIITIKVTADNGDESEYKINVLLKKRDLSIREIKIDDKEIEISKVMKYETYKKDIHLEIAPTDPEAYVDNDYKELKPGENIITIKVEADGDENEYQLVVNRLVKEGPGEATITKFALDGENIEFKNNNATLEIDDKGTFHYSYELSDQDAKLEIYLNDKPVKKSLSLKEDDNIKIVVTDKYDNENIYNIKVTKASSIPGIAIYGPVALAVAGTSVVASKKKKK